MNNVDVHHSQIAGYYRLAAVMAGAVALGFSVSSMTGVVALLAATLAAPIGFHWQKARSTGKPQLALRLAPSGIEIARGLFRGITIPWDAVEEVCLRRGGRGGTRLGIRVRHPEQFMGWFMRLNFRFERFQINVPLAGLDRTPKDVVGLAQQFVSAYSQPGKTA